MRGDQGQRGQAAVETALVMPMHVFLLLGILQINLAYHAKLATEYAAFKAARSASVYRASCSRMIDAATLALGPTLPSAGGSGPRGRLTAAMTAALDRRNEVPGVGTPMVIVQFYIDAPRADGRFDDPLGPGEAAMTIHVRVGYFFEYRVPFANWLITRYWLAMHLFARTFDSVSPTMSSTAAGQPLPAGFDAELLEIAKLNLRRDHYATPVVATWSMRMMSDPLAGKLGRNPYRTCRCIRDECRGD